MVFSEVFRFSGRTELASVPANSEAGTGGYVPREFRVGVIAGVGRRRDSVITLLSAAGTLASGRVKSDPRPSILTQDAQHTGLPSVFGESGRGKWFHGWGGRGVGRLRAVVALVREHLPGDDRHAASHDRDGVVGAFAAEALLAVERAEVIGAAHRHPRGLDERPFQPAVAERQHAAVRDFAAGGVRRRHQSGVGAEFVGGGEARDLVDLEREDGGKDLADARQGLQPLGLRVRGVFRDDNFSSASTCVCSRAWIARSSSSSVRSAGGNGARFIHALPWLLKMSFTAGRSSSG